MVREMRGGRGKERVRECERDERGEGERVDKRG